MPSFLDPQEFNLLMDCNNIGQDPLQPQYYSRSIPLDDLKRFHDAGVRTVLQFVPWTRTEPKQGEYDWSFVDEMVDRCRRANLKVILMGPNDVPDYFDDDWYVWMRDGTVMRRKCDKNITQSWACLSPWNCEAIDYYHNYARKLMARYNADDVLCVQSWSQEGESLLPPLWDCLSDPHALMDWHREHDDNTIPNALNLETQEWMQWQLRFHLECLQQIYSGNPIRTISFQMHPVYVGWPSSGVGNIYPYVASTIEHVKPANVLYWMFSVFQGHEGTCMFFIRYLQQMGCQLIVGSEWPEGLKRNTATALSWGIRALLTAPLHPYLKRDKIESWVFDAVKWSGDQYRTQRR